MLVKATLCVGLLAAAGGLALWSSSPASEAGRVANVPAPVQAPRGPLVEQLALIESAAHITPNQKGAWQELVSALLSLDQTNP